MNRRIPPLHYSQAMFTNPFLFVREPRSTKARLWRVVAGETFSESSHRPGVSGLLNASPDGKAELCHSYKTPL
ncbi:MAG: hypothetical protein RBT80_01435 [Candidatus Vecturithrix sp.]|jgi:hypothetical protein|nr:hypothetical protein [Candidatus Vecturithrix sp.]